MKHIRKIKWCSDGQSIKFLEKIKTCCLAEANGIPLWKVKNWLLKKCTRHIPRWSPNQVLTPPNRTWLRWSDENHYVPCGVVIYKRKKWRVAQLFGLSIKSLRRKAFNRGCDEIAKITSTSQLHNQKIPKLAKTSNHLNLKRKVTLKW